MQWAKGAPGEKAAADTVVEGLRDAFEDDDTKAVILKINSPGGSPVQSSDMYKEIVRLREETGCNVVALLEDGRVQVDPGPEQPLNEGATLVLIAPGESERRFLERYGD